MKKLRILNRGVNPCVRVSLAISHFYPSFNQLVLYLLYSVGKFTLRLNILLTCNQNFVILSYSTTCQCWLKSEILKKSATGTTYRNLCLGYYRDGICVRPLKVKITRILHILLKCYSHKFKPPRECNAPQPHTPAK